MIVSGPPGSVKTTVSSALASVCERGVHLESDWFFRSIRSGFVAPWLPEAHTQNAAVMAVAADAAAAYADAATQSCGTELSGRGSWIALPVALGSP